VRANKDVVSVMAAYFNITDARYNHEDEMKNIFLHIYTNSDSVNVREINSKSDARQNTNFKINT